MPPNEQHVVSTYWQLDCLYKSLFILIWKEPSMVQYGEEDFLRFFLGAFSSWLASRYLGTARCSYLARVRPVDTATLRLRVSSHLNKNFRIWVTWSSVIRDFTTILWNIPAIFFIDKDEFLCNYSVIFIVLPIAKMEYYSFNFLR